MTEEHRSAAPRSASPDAPARPSSSQARGSSQPTAPKVPTPSLDPVFLELIQAARGGCAESTARLVQECRPYLLSIANVEIDDEIAAKVGASDIVQNSVLSAQRCIDDFQGHSREELLAWLRGILIKDLQQTRRHYHAKKRNVGRELPLSSGDRSTCSIPLHDDLDSPSTAASEREQEQILMQAMQGLTDDEQQVIDLRNWQRLSFADIGALMNRSPDAARKLWSRAIVHLQKAMDEPDG